VCVTFTESQPCQTPPGSGTRLYASPAQDEGGEPALSVWRLRNEGEVSYRLRCSYEGDRAEFDILDRGSQVRVAWSDDLPFGDVVSILVGPVLGCVLRARGITSLHASALACCGGAIVVIGPKGGGKSSLAANLCAQGIPMLTDDIAALKESQGQFLVQPGYPRMRQWPSTLSALSDLDPEALPRVVSPADKRYLDLASHGSDSRWRFQPEAQLLLGVYVLDALGSVGTAPRIEPIPPAEGLVALVRNTYADYMLDREGRARDFKLLGRVAAKIPLRLVRRPLGLDSVPRVCQSILEDAKGLSG